MVPEMAQLEALLDLTEPQQQEASMHHHPAELPNNRLRFVAQGTNLTLSTSRAVFSTHSRLSSSKSRQLYSKKCSVNGQWVTKWETFHPLIAVQIWIPEQLPQLSVNQDNKPNRQAVRQEYGAAALLHTLPAMCPLSLRSAS